MDFYYKQPVEIIFGNGKLSLLPELLGGARSPLIVTAPFFLEKGPVKELAERLSGGTYTQVSENPDVSEVNECSRLIREDGFDIIIAVGGGSVMDLAKAASVRVEDIREYHGTGKPVPLEDRLPLIAVPTTAGTGSEVTCVSVLTERETGKKCPIVSDGFFPKLALIDPELTVSMPPHITACTGIDVLCHSIEGYWSRGHQPICDELAVHAAKTVFKWLPKAYSQPEDLQAREKMAEASMFAGLAFSLPKTTASHACSFPLTSIYGIPHGEACGLTLDLFARVNREDPRTAVLAERLGFGSVEELADQILALKKLLCLRISIADLISSDQQINELVQKSHHPNLQNNPVQITDRILYSIYDQLRK
ncbi:MAG: iron-containing alcohol dehydrogenase [Ruminococcus sp.]|nr:iron-containing alcohol dehydrogenase [Ruminococcus sp.]